MADVDTVRRGSGDGSPIHQRIICRRPSRNRNRADRHRAKSQRHHPRRNTTSCHSAGRRLQGPCAIRGTMRIRGISEENRRSAARVSCAPPAQPCHRSVGCRCAPRLSFASANASHARSHMRNVAKHLAANLWRASCPSSLNASVVRELHPSCRWDMLCGRNLQRICAGDKNLTLQKGVTTSRGAATVRIAPQQWRLRDRPRVAQHGDTSGLTSLSGAACAWLWGTQGVALTARRSHSTNGAKPLHEAWVIRNPGTGRSGGRSALLAACGRRGGLRNGSRGCRRSVVGHRQRRRRLQCRLQDRSECLEELHGQ